MNDFFKYISEILAKFSPAQRILALLMLLLTITAIIVTPIIVNANTTTYEECGTKTGRLEKRITALETENDTLIISIRRNQAACTNAIIQREDEFMALLDELKRDITKEAKKKSKIQLETVSEYVIASDTIREYPVTASSYHTVEAPQPDVASILKKIDCAKDKVKK